jgi:hypothetical protein
VVVALGVTGVVSTVAILSRYAYARPLTNDGGGYSWSAPDSLSTTFTRLGAYSVLAVPARFGQSQSFYFQIHNNSNVTQTILGLAGPGDTAEPEVLAVATKTDYRLNESSFTYRSGPMALPPHSDRFARLTINLPSCPGWSTQVWDRVQLRVRVGAFTKTQTVRFFSTNFELTRPTSAC